jgi:hypothetical protein
MRDVALRVAMATNFSCAFGMVMDGNWPAACGFTFAGVATLGWLLEGCLGWRSERVRD